MANLHSDEEAEGSIPAKNRHQMSSCRETRLQMQTRSQGRSRCACRAPRADLGAKQHAVGGADKASGEKGRQMIYSPIGNRQQKGSGCLPGGILMHCESCDLS